MENKYYFQVTNWKGESSYSAPIEAPTYGQALHELYKANIEGAILKAIRLWGGRTVISAIELYNPTNFDVIL